MSTVHCRAHGLNLTLVHSSTKQNITMFAVVQEVAVYLGGSAKRLEKFREVDNENPIDDMPNRHTIRKLSDTRDVMHLRL